MMGNWSLYGIIIMTIFFMAILTFVLSQIQIDNPFGTQSSVLQLILSWF